MIFRHKIISESDYVVELLENGNWRMVNKTKPEYLKWVEQGNIPEVIPFVPEPIEQLRMRAINKSISGRTDKFDGGFEFETDIYDTSPASRELIGWMIKIAEKKPDSYKRKVVLKNGNIKELTKAKISDLDLGIEAYGEALYNEWLATYELLLVADRAALEKYLKDGVIP